MGSRVKAGRRWDGQQRGLLCCRRARLRRLWPGNVSSRNMARQLPGDSAAPARSGGGPAASGAAGAPVGQPWGELARQLGPLTWGRRAWVMQELGRLLDAGCGFQDLMRLVDANKRQPLRQVLSHHGTWSCQPGRDEGPRRSAWESLKACGLEELLDGSWCTRDVVWNCGCSLCGGEPPTRPRGRPDCYVQLEGWNMFVAGDGLGWIYESAPWSSHRAAEHHACLELLAFLLVVAPYAVHLHPSTMANADDLRAAAVEVRRKFLARPPAAPRGLAWTCALVPWTSTSIRACPTRSRRPFSGTTRAQTQSNLSAQETRRLGMASCAGPCSTR